MSTRSATIIRQTTYYGEMDVNTEELMRFYRNCDGYPEGHGMQMALAVKQADERQVINNLWLQAFLTELLGMDNEIEFEPYGCTHGDLEYLYVVEGIVDRRCGTKSGNLPVTISVYAFGFGWDESYHDVLKQEPVFKGTAYEYIETFGKEQ